MRSAFALARLSGKAEMQRNILLFVSSMNSGGAERVAANLVNAWAARGDAVTLVVTYSGRGGCFYPLSDTVRLIYLADLAGRTGRGVWDYCVRYWALRQLIRRLQPEVVVSFLTHVNVASILASLGLGCRVIVCERIYPPMLQVGMLWTFLRRITYPWAFRVVMLSREGLAWLEARVPDAKGVVIPNPVPFPLPMAEPVLAAQQVIAPERQLLLAVGRLDAQKGFDLLLESFAALAARHPAWSLVILGEGPERGRLEHTVRMLELTRRVTLPGQAGNMSDWYNRAALYVMSSRFEGFPNTLAEAMAHGCAAVSYDCDTGPRDIIRHEQDGLLVTPVGDVAALTKALDRLMSDDTDRNRMATRATEVRERYSMKKVLTLWDELFVSTKCSN
jgi:glycosyltransferase involved in cell wall biosynthesis